MTMLEKQLQSNAGRGAIRFQVSLPMQYRIFGERVWREGWAETMSVAEILFRSSKDLDVGKGMDIRIVLPSPQRGAHGGTIVGKARVLRCIPMSDMPGQSLIAASLSSARLLHFAEESNQR